MRASIIAAGALLFAHPSVTAAAEVTYAVMASQSSVRVHVGKSGLFSFAGHRHEVDAPPSGTVTADAANPGASSLELSFASARLRVLPEGEPAGDAPKVEALMQGAQVLDILRFPEIHFRSKKVSARVLGGGAFDVTITGELSLHGVTRELTVPVRVTIEGRSLTATGRVTLRHDQFGMKPVSAGGGTVKVANDLPIDFKIVAEER
jgi:polyisoprenoid-binding protein YceI